MRPLPPRRWNVTKEGNHMPKFQINDLAMSTDCSVSWTDDRGQRFHVWLVSNRDGQDYELTVPVEPYEVRSERPMGHAFKRRTLYLNCPRNEDGSHKNRWQHGYFQTRHLDADAKKNAPLVAEALRRAKDEGLYEKAKQEVLQARIEKARAEQQAKIAKVGAAVVKLEAEMIEEGKEADAKRIVDAFAKLPRESMIRFHDIMMRN